MPDVMTHLTKEQLADRWQVTTRTIENMVARGECPAPIKLGYKTIRWALIDIETHELAKK
jgi:predicted DNA-binding transcriptional regulator AlpA